jgi:hypothetical protein
MAASVYLRLLVFAFFFLFGALENSHAETKIPSTWADYSQTLLFEKLLYQSIQDGSTKNLSSTYEQIVEKDVPVIEHLQNIAKSGDEGAQRIMLIMNPCQYAGLFIRLFILGVYRNTESNEGRIVPPSSNATTMFAENVWRCERLGRKPITQRLIGSP